MCAYKEVEMSQHRLRMQHLHQQQMHFFATNRNYYDSGSEESLNRYLFNTECMPMPQERCGSPSYSLRYDMHDVYGRRRSSSSSHEDILLNPNFQQKIHIDPRYRDTRPIASNSSLNRDYEAPPMIYVEEYDDVIRNDNDSLSGNSDNRSAESIQNQPLNEDSMASCVDSDDIPFIDDDNSPPSVHTYLPPSSSSQPDVRHVSSKSPGIIVKNRRDSGASCRKTVSFDIINDDEALPLLMATTTTTSNNAVSTTDGNNVRKSSTCDYLRNDTMAAAQEAMAVDEEVMTVGKRMRKKCSGTKETILKFCKLKKWQDQHFGATSSSTGDNANDDHCGGREDNFSIYFDKDGDQPVAVQTPSNNTIDLSEMSLDLTGIHSDSTTTSQSGGENGGGQGTNNKQHKRYSPPTIDYDRVIERKNVGHRVVWSSTPPYHDDVILGNGKVRALTKYFNFLHGSTKSNIPPTRRSQSFPNLHGYDDEKLSAAERLDVMVQLREWSKFGSQAPKCNTDKCASSVVNLMEYGKCHHMDEIFNRIDNIPPPNRFKSTPNIASYHPGCHKKFPDAYIVMKKRPSACCTINHDLTRKPIHIQSLMDIPGATPHPTHMTLRQIKSRHASKAHKNDGRHNIPHFYSR